MLHGKMLQCLPGRGQLVVKFVGFPSGRKVSSAKADVPILICSLSRVRAVEIMVVYQLKKCRRYSNGKVFVL